LLQIIVNAPAIIATIIRLLIVAGEITLVYSPARMGEVNISSIEEGRNYGTRQVRGNEYF
jgi:hypothetical protein